MDKAVVYSLAMGAGTFLVHQNGMNKHVPHLKTALLQELQKRDTLNSLYKQLDSYICFRGGKSWW